MIDLKLCPFCGGEAEVIHARISDGNVSFGATWIACKNCKCQTQEYANDGYYGERYSDADVAAIWNRRFQAMNNDLISRSALLDGLNKLYMAALRKTAHSVETIYELDHLAMLVNDAPTVDAEVVRHGRWIAIEEQQWNCFGQIFVGYSCSECNAEGSKTWNYCPNCGARMDGGADGD